MNESVQKWLDELTTTPATAIQKLVLGYAGVSAWSRSSLRESFVEIFQTHAEQLDAAVTAWLQDHLMKLPSEKTPMLVWASHLQDLFSALAGLPLPRVARLLRDRLRDFRSWLRPMRTDEGLDPEAAYLAAVAWADTNQNLEGLWRGLAMRRADEPVYYVDIGLLGLRKTRDEKTKMPPPKAPFLLLATLIDLADSGISQKDWLLTTRALLGGYHYSSETWVREFESVLEARPDAKHGPDWLKKVLPSLRGNQDYLLDIRPAHSIEEKDAIIAEVAENGPKTLGERLTAFLGRERTYANITRNSHFLVRTFNRLAEAARNHDPNWSIARAEEALAWDENNVRNWTVLARCLWARGRVVYSSGDLVNGKACLQEAIDTLWYAQLLFPADAYCRTELAKIVRASGDHETAVAIYREAIAEFPNNPWCLTGLADVLLQRSIESDNTSERDEARSLLQQAAAMGDAYARTRLENIARRDEQSVEGINIGPPQLTEMRPAQRLGRALLLQWLARRTKPSTERERLFAAAEALLDFPDELTGECQTAFVEARGFLLLARDQAANARAYFYRQIVATAPRSPIGLRIGFSEARARLGETISDEEEAELASFGPYGSVLPLVLKVLRLLESGDDIILGEILQQIYPRAREMMGMPLAELGDDEEVVVPTAKTVKAQTIESRMAHLLIADIFHPANIKDVQSLKDKDVLPRIRSAFKEHRNEIFAVVEKFSLAA